METVIYYEEIIKEGGWHLKKERKGLKVSTKIEESTVGVLVEAELDVGIEHFFSVLTEIDLMKKWMPFMESSKLEKIVSRNCRIGHCINNFPFISKRESFFQGIGYDRVDHDGTVLMYSRSLNGNDELQKELGYLVKETEGAIQLDYRYLVLQYRPCTLTSGNLKLAINVDMKLSIPMFILAPATEGFGVDFYENILKIAKNIKGSKWEYKIKENPEFFQFLQARIQEHFRSKSIKKVEQI